ncbi:protein FAM124B [Oryzias melastigma]|uniref:Family with sequence similarity 124B n=1 Tax=Oryzias melastigma TaxID=30732 RepID=A0A3B3B991_ORYME|nr:protein FAM124B [Oryzias melastigma]
MRRGAAVFGRRDHENPDSGAETAASECSRMSLSAFDPLAGRVRPRRRQQQLLLMNMHLLANPGDSLLLQHSLDRLLRWLCPSLRIFHVSERAAPFRSFTRPSPVAGYPSLAITFFLHEAYGEERILRVLDVFQRPPWQYHHTESCGGRTGGIHVGSSASAGLLRPYLLPSRDFYSLGAGMPVWGVRPVHCGGEILRVTLYSCHGNYEDAVRLYETVLQRRAEEQKAGFSWFTLHTEPGLTLQLALKQLSPGVRVEPCVSTVLQFSVEEIGQLVPLLPNPCTPISATRWQTEDLDGNKMLFQVNAPAQSQQPLTCAFPPTLTLVPPRGPKLRTLAQGSSLSLCSRSAPFSWQNHRQGQRPRSDPALEKLYGGAGSLGTGSCCSTPPGSSCYSSQCSSPAQLSTFNHPDSTLGASITCSLPHLPLEEDEEESETNVDTGVAVSPCSDSAVIGVPRSSSTDLLMTVLPERPAAAVVQERTERLPQRRTPCGAWGSGGSTDLLLENSSTVTELNCSGLISVENKTELLSAGTQGEDPADEFFI